MAPSTKPTGIGVRTRESMRADAYTDTAIALSARGAGEGCGDGAATVRRRGAQGPMRSRRAGVAPMIAVEIQPSEGALEFGACFSHRDSDAVLAAHTVAVILLHAKQYPGSRRTVCNITHDSDVMSNKIARSMFGLDLPAPNCRQ